MKNTLYIISNHDSPPTYKAYVNGECIEEGSKKMLRSLFKNSHYFNEYPSLEMYLKDYKSGKLC